MKLYTEEQVKKAIDEARLYDIVYRTHEEILNLLNPIQIPSDDEIIRLTQYLTENYYLGVKWMKEQILNQTK